MWYNMGRKGWKTITVTEDIHAILKTFADATHRSVPKTIEYLVDHCQPLLTAPGAEANDP